jgi:hypothetical protein
MEQIVSFKARHDGGETRDKKVVEEAGSAR